MINAILIDNINDNKIDVTVIMHNLQRQKSERELVQEADYWCDIIPNNQGKRPEKEESETGKKRGTRYDKIAEIMDDIISPRTIQRIQAIKDAEKTAKEEGNQELLQSSPYIIKIRKEELSKCLNNIYHFLRRFDNYDMVIYLTFDDNSTRDSLPISSVNCCLNNLSSMLMLESTSI